MKNDRNYGIDLLRLVLMYMVCLLHTIGQGGILNACQTGTVAYKVFWLLIIFSYCAVAGFVLISGYMAVDKPRKYEKNSRYVVSGILLFFCTYYVLYNNRT